MAEQQALSPARAWSMRLIYICICMGILMLELLPLQTEPRSFAGPELVLLLTFTFALRRPEYVPAWAVGVAVLLGDLLLHRPPGLLAGLTVLASEALRARSDNLRTLPFSVEGLTAALAVLGVLIGYRIVLALFMIPQAPLLLAVSQMVSTIFAYPVIVLGSVALFGVRRVAPGEIDSHGHRI